DDEEAKRVWAPVGRAVIEAAAAFGAGDRARAAALLDPVMPMMTAIGGSDAQDDLFRQTYLRSLQAAGRRADAAADFEAITADKSPTALDRALASGRPRWRLAPRAGRIRPAAAARGLRFRGAGAACRPAARPNRAASPARSRIRAPAACRRADP